MEDDDRVTDAEGRGLPADLRDDHTISLGTKVGGYVIDGELGRGGMGIVYAATHPVIGKRAAIKVLRPSMSRNPGTVERFIQEARSVNQIGHPNIVDIFDFGRLEDGRYFLVMDLLEGESLRRRVKRGPLPLREAVAVIDEIASALIAAHDKGFIHRDLKPDNVFLVAHPGRLDVRLLDFGLAKMMPTAASANDRAFRTATGTQLGTPDYMSPEQLRGGRDIDARTDIYALGVMAFEIITGTRPRRHGDGTFELGKTPGEVVGAVTSVPAELAQLVETMLESAPEQRPSLVAIRAVVKRMLPSLPADAVVELPAEPGPPNGGAGSSMMSLTASRVGARPVLPTPALGAPTVAAMPTPPTAPSPATSGLDSAPTYSKTKLGVAAAISLPPRLRPGDAIAPPFGSVAGRAPGSVGEARPSRRPPWWLIATVLVIAAAVAVAIVIAS